MILITNITQDTVTALLRYLVDCVGMYDISSTVVSQDLTGRDHLVIYKGASLVRDESSTTGVIHFRSKAVVSLDILPSPLAAEYEGTSTDDATMLEIIGRLTREKERAREASRRAALIARGGGVQGDLPSMWWREHVGTVHGGDEQWQQDELPVFQEQMRGDFVPAARRSAFIVTNLQDRAEVASSGRPTTSAGTASANSARFSFNPHTRR